MQTNDILVIVFSVLAIASLGLILKEYLPGFFTRKNQITVTTGPGVGDMPKEIKDALLSALGGAPKKKERVKFLCKMQDYPQLLVLHDQKLQERQQAEELGNMIKAFEKAKEERWEEIESELVKLGFCEPNSALKWDRDGTVSLKEEE